MPKLPMRSQAFEEEYGDYQKRQDQDGNEDSKYPFRDQQGP
jgi:hypothetical protein